ncbi:hypothetical protein [Sporolactobacillus pectinivorans]|uniref:hypothetical protein n=1 Tax=Sporolactobacillus pectinivorans TaxID=1591408 RepID=UPI000C262260|nr:hypothetical protein [Sporolactobacillus pectinivorans]
MSISWDGILSFFGSLIGAGIPFIIIYIQGQREKNNKHRLEVSRFNISFESYSYYFESLNNVLNSLAVFELERHRLEMKSENDELKKAVLSLTYCLDKLDKLNDYDFINNSHLNFIEVKDNLEKIKRYSLKFIEGDNNLNLTKRQEYPYSKFIKDVNNCREKINIHHNYLNEMASKIN